MAAAIAAPGRLIAGRYRLGEELGRGGMATVYRARDQQLDREVALKLIDSGPASDSDFSPAFVDEARASAALQHPNIVTVFDAGTHQDRPFIVMEMVDGGDLRALLRE